MLLVSPVLAAAATASAAVTNISGTLADVLDTVVGAGNSGRLTAITQTAPGSTSSVSNVDLNGFQFTINSGGGNAQYYNGAITGPGTLRIVGRYDATWSPDPQLGGTLANSPSGVTLTSGYVFLNKNAGVDALAGAITVNAAAGNTVRIKLLKSDQINDASTINSTSSGGAFHLELNNLNETIAGLSINSGHTVDTGTGSGGVLKVTTLTVGGVSKPKGAYTVSSGFVTGTGYIDVDNFGPPVILLPPGVPASPSPAVAATTVHPANAKLTWSACTDATSYDVYLWPSVGSKPASPTVNVALSEYTPSPQLLSLTNYTWQVVAKNTIGSTPGPEWNFSTVDRTLVAGNVGVAYSDFTHNLNYIVGTGNSGKLLGDFLLHWAAASGSFSVPLDTTGFALSANTGGGNGGHNASGPISGAGSFTIYNGPHSNGFWSSLYTISGSVANTYSGGTFIKQGQVLLGKTPGVDALTGAVTLGSVGTTARLIWGANNQINDAAAITVLLPTVNNGFTPDANLNYLDLAGFSDTIGSLTLPDDGTKTQVRTGTGGVLTLGALTVGGTVMNPGSYTAGNSTFVLGTGSVLVSGATTSADAAISTVSAAPSSVVANGTSASTITVTLLDSGGIPVGGKTVALASNRGATDTIAAASGMSNAAGVVTFSVKSTTPGAAVFSATDTSDTVTVAQTAGVTFTALPAPGFDEWVASGKGLSGAAAAFDADPDHDGIPNGIEYVLGGEPNPARAGASSRALLPTAVASGNNLVFTYFRRDEAAYLNPVVEFSTNLSGPWSTAAAGNATIEVFDGTPADTVRVTIPKGANSRLFARLKVGTAPVTGSIPPRLTTAPLDTTVTSGADLTLTAAAEGTPPFTVQWYFNGSAIGGATGSSYTVTGATVDNQGDYQVVVSSAQGTVTSGLVHVTIIVPTVAGEPADTYPGFNLIPWPKSIAVQQGQMDLTSSSRIVTGDASLNPLAAIVSNEILLLTGLNLPVVSDAARSGDIVLHINPAIIADEQILVTRPPALVRTTDGAHTLTIGTQAVIDGFDYRAVAEGTVTLLQALRQAGGAVALPKLAIKDWPHADYCAMMIDCGRQDQPIAALKKMVETCRMYKVRYMHLHLTDDQGWTFPSTTYPQLGSQNGAAHGGVTPEVYTLAGLRDLVAYADARGIAIVPELEMPGHSGAALRSLPAVFDAINPQTGQPVGLGCMNMTSETFYSGLDTIIGEMCDVFRSSPYFHIGSDEVTMGRVSLNSGYTAFMAAHGLTSDSDLANYFVARVNGMIKARGKKTIKWEGLANTAAPDVIIMTWDSNSNMASQLIAQGFATITCPWNLGVPWDQWSMYICNGSVLHKGDAVLGATLVAWEQSADTQIGMTRNVAARQERTWGPDNVVTDAGFASRFQPQDAAVGKLIGLPPQAVIAATFTASAGTRDLLDPVFAFDGNDATFYKSATAPLAGDNFTIALAQSALVYGIDVLTGINGKGLMTGAQVQVSSDGSSYLTVATLANGTATAVLADPHVKYVRLWCPAPQSDPMVVREIKLQLLVAMSGTVASPGTVLGADDIALLTGNTTFYWVSAANLNRVINQGFTLTFNSGGGNQSGYNGPITGTGTVQIYQGPYYNGFRNTPMIFAGSDPNTMTGTWQVKAGRLTLAKDPGVDAVCGTIIVGGQGDNDCLYWANNDQVNDAATVQLLDSANGGASLNLNGCSDRFASLQMAANTRIVTDDVKLGGILTVGSLTLNGTSLPAGVYTSANSWITGSGFVVVGNIQFVNAAGVITNANTTIGANNIAVLTAATTFGPATGNCSIPVITGGFGLTLRASGSVPTSYSGFIIGTGGVAFDASASGVLADRQPFEITGPSPNTYSGATVLTRGVLKLNKPAGVIAIPGNLSVGGNTAANAGDTVLLAADGQLSASATVTLDGSSQPCYLDLGGHTTAVAKVLLSGQAKIHTGTGGHLTVRQLIVNGTSIVAGTYQIPQAWMDGSGSVTIDPRVDIAGAYYNPNVDIGVGNIGNMTGDTTFGWVTGTTDIDVITNGHTFTMDSGDGNAFCYMGTISGTGDVVLLMGPSYTGYKDAPMRLAGTKPNTTSGTFHAAKGRVQLEKPAGVDAISGDVIVGGQGFNDCLHWINSNQIKNTATITLLDAGNSGAAYLSLNGCSETVAALVMAANTRVLTDNTGGQAGVLTVKSLTVANVAKPAGTYTSASGPWIVGNGTIIVTP